MLEVWWPDASGLLRDHEQAALIQRKMLRSTSAHPVLLHLPAGLPREAWWRRRTLRLRLYWNTLRTKGVRKKWKSLPCRFASSQSAAHSRTLQNCVNKWLNDLQGSLEKGNFPRRALKMPRWPLAIGLGGLLFFLTRFLGLMSFMCHRSEMKSPIIAAWTYSKLWVI